MLPFIESQNKGNFLALNILNHTTDIDIMSSREWSNECDVISSNLLLYIIHDVSLRFIFPLICTEIASVVFDELGRLEKCIDHSPLVCSPYEKFLNLKPSLVPRPSK